MPSIIFKCRYCPQVLPNFKTLVEHYKACHEKGLHGYMILHDNHKALTFATSEEEACKMHFGWEIGDCQIRRIE